MKSASKEIKIEKAKKKDIDELVDLIYITEPKPEEEWGYEGVEERRKNLKTLLGRKNNRFSIENIIVLRKDKKLVGMLLYLQGNQIDELTKTSEQYIAKKQQGIFHKLEFKIAEILDKIYCKECEKNEFYLSNIAIKEEYRGNHYSEILFEKAYEMARKKGYKKVSLLSKNEELIKFYEKIGFELVDEKNKRMVKEI